VSGAPSRGRPAAIAALLVVVLIWSSTFVATKLLFGQAGPSQIALLRFVVAFAILLPFTWRGLARRTLPWGRLALMGLSGVAGYFTLQNIGLVYTSASDAALILACLPALVAVAAAAFLGERLNRLRGLGVLASVVGVVVIVLLGEPEPTAPDPLLGNGLMLLCALSWVVYTTLGKGTEQLPALIVSAGSIAFGTLFIAPVALVETLGRGLPTLTGGGWLGILYLGLGASAGAFFLWNYALRRLDASEAAVYLNLVPLLGVILAAVTLHESIGPAEVLGAALIVGGVTFAGRATSPAPVEQAQGKPVEA
jgi:drug/metabolite transporter (DMT)-like permease